MYGHCALTIRYTQLCNIIVMIISKGRKTGKDKFEHNNRWADALQVIISEYSMTEFCADCKKYQSVYQWLLTTHHRKNTEKKQSTTPEFIENVDLCP